MILRIRCVPGSSPGQAFSRLAVLRRVALVLPGLVTAPRRP